MGHASKAALVPYHWQKGQSGNPNGRPRGEKHFRKASPEALARIVDAFLYGGPTGLEDLYNSPDVNAVEKFAIQVISKAANKGDAFALGMVLDRFVGKVPDKLETKNVNVAIDPYAELTDDDLAKRAALLEEADRE